jgi:hypothetical protein
MRLFECLILGIRAVEDPTNFPSEKKRSRDTLRSSAVLDLTFSTEAMSLK